METHTSAQDAAKYLVWLAAHECEDDPDFLTPLKLQKLLYYLQGWAFAEWGKPFFSERIEAWRDGPVVPVVYAQYKGREKLPIVPEQLAEAPLLGEQERALVRSVWDAYKRYSGWALRDMTHQEQPYLEAYTPQDDHRRCSKAIDNASMARHFKGRGEAAVARLGHKRSKLRAFAAANTRARVGRDVF